MCKSPNTRNFNAWINLQLPGPSRLIVKGEVETKGGNLVPKLSRAEPQGINPHQLILVLSFEDAGNAGTDDMVFLGVHYEEAASSGQYTSVAVQSDGDFVQVLDVSEVH